MQEKLYVTERRHKARGRKRRLKGDKICVPQGHFLTLIHEHERKERSLSVTNGIMKSCLKYHSLAIITKCEIIRHLFKG